MSRTAGARVSQTSQPIFEHPLLAGRTLPVVSVRGVLARILRDMRS